MSLIPARSPIAAYAVLLVASRYLFPALLFCQESAPTPQPSAPASLSEVKQTITSGIDFLIRDAANWRKEHTCSTCHHGTMTVWALTEAKQRGFSIDANIYADNLTWTKQRILERIDLPRDTRPGWSMVNSSAIYLSVMATLLPQQDALTIEDLSRIRGHLLRHQEANGAWAWSSAPPLNRPPPFFESDEVATLLTCLALKPHANADPSNVETQEALSNARQWLENSEHTETTQALALRLIMAAHRANPSDEGPPELAKLLERQNEDGGFSQLAAANSDAYATGQALLALHIAGVSPEHADVIRAVTYLVHTQRDDGSWPMTRRGHPGVTPSENVIPITHLGAAWATIGLIRSTPQ